MTWQRIDNDIYIDDTLVTCAEYQLFIDEMREQGKYYQPDHWNSYQFQRGQAREPMLGVRQSDAEVFCEWLTEREQGFWKFRLSVLTEVIAFPAKSHKTKPIGYWLNEKFQFTLPGTVNKDIRNMYNAISSDLLLFLPRDIFPIFKITQALNHAYACARPLDLDHNVNEVIARDIHNAIDRRGDIAIARNHARDYDPAYTWAREFSPDTVFDPSPECPLAQYVDFLTLQERIARRSPAFEGIRLVKERIK